MAAVDFQANISTLEAALEKANAELAELEQQWATYDIQTQETRDAIQALRDVLDGNIPAASAAPRARRSEPISALSVNEETGRPARGARRKQIEQICQRIGRGGKVFRTLDVLNELADIEDGLSEGMKSYAYAVLTTLEKDGVLRKVKRGTWELS